MSIGPARASSHGARLSRRAALARIAGLIVTTMVGATSAAAASDSEQIAAWFFERYLLQSINLAHFNAKQLSSDAGKAVEQEAPSLQRFLERHRPAFVSALLPLVADLVPAEEAVTVAEEVQSEGSKISARTRELLVAVDEEFQKNEQKLLRALSYELNVLVEQILANIRKSP